MSFGQRLNLLMLNEKQTNKSAFARRINTTPTTVNNLLKDVHEPQRDLIESIYRAFPKYTLNWLVTGEDDLNGQQPAGTVAVQLSTGHQANNTQNVGDMAALAIAQERIKALEDQVQQLTARLADKDEIIALLKKQG